jgi:hypothetical protein
MKYTQDKGVFVGGMDYQGFISLCPQGDNVFTENIKMRG